MFEPAPSRRIIRLQTVLAENWLKVLDKDCIEISAATSILFDISVLARANTFPGHEDVVAGQHDLTFLVFGL